MTGGHHETPPVPDWRHWKIEDVPELVKTKKALQAHGLHDPWLRNEVWRYTTVDGYSKSDPLMAARKLFSKNLAFRGFKLGLILAIATTAIGKLIEGDHHHGHDGH